MCGYGLDAVSAVLPVESQNSPERGNKEVAGEVWDFSSFCDVNLNPYNFANEKHFNRAVADCMVNIMYGAEAREDFGIVLTPENILPYLLQRRADFKKLRAEYLMNGYVQLKGMDDPSYIPLEDYGY